MTVLLPAWPISAMFTCQPISAPLTCILSTAALLKLCHNKTILMREYTNTHTHNGNCGSVYNLQEGEKKAGFI